MTRVVNSRIRFLLLLIVVAFGALLARAAWIQTVRAASLSRLATAQTRIPVVLPAGRGTIFDAMGTPLALGEQATTIFADPRQITHPLTDATIAARVLQSQGRSRWPGCSATARTGSSTSSGRRRRSTRPRSRRRTSSASASIRRSAASIRRGRWPRPCSASRASTTTGSPASSCSSTRSSPASRARRRSSAIRSATSSRSRTRSRRARGRTCSSRSTTPSRRTRSRCCARRSPSGTRRTRRRSCSTRTRAACSRWRCSRATTRTRSRPRRERLQSNHAVTDVFEPGSVFKVVTIAGALSEHLVTPQTSFTLPYSIRVADRVIHDAEVRPTERMTVAQILQRSSNVGAVTIATNAARAEAAAAVDLALRLRQADRHRLPGRELGAAAVVLVRLDDRQRSDRPGHLGDGDPARVRLRGDRERRPVDPAASRRPRPGRAAAAAEDAADRLRAASTGSC